MHVWGKTDKIIFTPLLPTASKISYANKICLYQGLGKRAVSVMDHLYVCSGSDNKSLYHVPYIILYHFMKPSPQYVHKGLLHKLVEEIKSKCKNQTTDNHSTASKYKTYQAKRLSTFINYCSRESLFFSECQ